MSQEEIISMIQDTGELVAAEKVTSLGNAVNAFTNSTQLVNEVEFWKWMGRNYSKDFTNSNFIQHAAELKPRWINTQLQGKGYEWDYMATQRMNPKKILSVFEAGDCPTQPGIDIIETGLLDGKVKATYQNKAYLSNNNPNLYTTPKDTIVVTNQEKIAYAKEQGYTSELYMNAEEVAKARDSRFDQAIQGSANVNYTLKNVAATSLKAGAFAAVIGMSIEMLVSYKSWKTGEISNEQYLKEVLKAGGDSGVTAGATTVVMIPIQAAITTAGASTLIAIPIVFALSTALNRIVAPCFGRGKYREILGEAKYYQSLGLFYEDFVNVVEQSSIQFVNYINIVQEQQKKYKTMKVISKQLDEKLEDLYDSI